MTPTREISHMLRVTFANDKDGTNALEDLAPRFGEDLIGYQKSMNEQTVFLDIKYILFLCVANDFKLYEIDDEDDPVFLSLTTIHDMEKYIKAVGKMLSVLQLGIGASGPLSPSVTNTLVIYSRLFVELFEHRASLKTIESKLIYNGNGLSGVNSF